VYKCGAIGVHMIVFKVSLQISIAPVFNNPK